MPADSIRCCDVAVIGGGFGGLGAALTLAGAGAAVVLLERAGYLGGCAGTFERDGQRWEAGATLCAGLGPRQLFGRWIAQHGLEVGVEPLQPVVTVRAGGLDLPVSADRAAMIATIVATAPDKQRQIEHFFALQQQIADALWSLLDDPRLLPPWDAAALVRHALRVPAYLPLVRWLGRPLIEVLAHCDVDRVPALRHLCDVTCQITVQCPAAEAEAPLALATLDYWFRGAGHVVGGLGALATALGEAVSACGGQVLPLHAVTSLERTAAGRWRLHHRRGVVEARAVVANLLPDALAALLRGEAAIEAQQTLQRRTSALQQGWGASMLYLTVRPAVADGLAHHYDLTDETGQLTAGHHVFLSVSSERDAKAASGLRTAVVSTHVPMGWWQGLDAAGQAAAQQAVVARMQRTLALRAPEWAAATVGTLTASPRTWQRFTGRPGGKVGGVPRRAGLHHYLELGPPEVARGLWLVGDSVFPGQSALATALGGQRAATAVLARLGQRSEQRSDGPQEPASSPPG